MQIERSVISHRGPKISIITVVYNAKDLLEETIKSVISQSYKNVEYLVIDGGSTDGTIEVIKEYEKDISYWISEPDNGIYDAMNKGTKLAHGDYVYFLGAGDIIHDVLLDVSTLLIDGNTIYYGNVFRNDTLKVYDGKFSPLKLAVKNICHQSIFYPTKVFKQYAYNTKYLMQADYDLNMRCYGDDRFKFQYIPITVSNYDGDGYSALNLDFPFYDDKLMIIKNNFSPIIYTYAYLRNKIAKILKIGKLNNLS